MTPSVVTYAKLVDLYPCGIFVGGYQRRYVWGREREPYGDSVTGLTDCLLRSYAEGEDYFLQGLTFDGADLIDGQQRLTYLTLVLQLLGCEDTLMIRYAGRPAATAFMAGEDADSDDPDVYFMRHTLRLVSRRLEESGADRTGFRDYLSKRVTMRYLMLPPGSDAVAIYRMMNGAKAAMLAPDVIKADIMRMASESDHPDSSEWDLESLRSRYANEWDSWVRWWSRPEIRECFATTDDQHPLDLLLRLCLRSDWEETRPRAGCLPPGDKLSIYAGKAFTFEEYRLSLALSGDSRRAAKQLFRQLRMTQKRIQQAYAEPDTYNRVRAVLLQQEPAARMRFLRMCFVAQTIDSAELDRYYRLSFLGMTIDEIASGDSAAERFDELLAALSMADVYHSEAKRDVFRLLLRLNIDEDIKLGRRFDFSVWDNRSLEHIYSKSKVWHTDERGRLYDGNDKIINMPASRISHERGYMPRTAIVNYDGTQLSEHCIGNLVLLYGSNNAEFGNATFEQKKIMFLSPGDATVFRSRNLMHSVCVFAGNSWDHRSIVDNYNRILKNLKIYYGFL